MKRKTSDVRDLIQNADDHPLSEVETLRLQAYEASDEGRAYQAIHTYLQDEMPARLPKFRLNRYKIKGVASQIEAQVQRKRRAQNIVSTTRTIALATAVFLIVFFGYNWLTAREFELEPVAAQPTATAVLAPRMKYAHLETAVPELLKQLPPVQYAHPLSETAAHIDFELSIPTQLDSDITFVGSMFNSEKNTAEIVLRSASKVAGWHRLWFLIQSPLDKSEQNQSLPLAYQLPWSKDVSGSAAITQETIEMLGTEALYEGYDLLYEDAKHYDMGEVISVRSLSWQTVDKQMTLTIISPNPVSADSMKQTLEKWHLAPYAP